MYNIIVWLGAIRAKRIASWIRSVGENWSLGPANSYRGQIIYKRSGSDILFPKYQQNQTVYE